MLKVVLNISKGLKNIALFYISISRVKGLDDVLFELPFNL